jgi:hypothetical protein
MATYAIFVAVGAEQKPMKLHLCRRHYRPAANAFIYSNYKGLSHQRRKATLSVVRT